MKFKLLVAIALAIVILPDKSSSAPSVNYPVKPEEERVLEKRSVGHAHKHSGVSSESSESHEHDHSAHHPEGSHHAHHKGSKHMGRAADGKAIISQTSSTSTTHQTSHSVSTSSTSTQTHTHSVVSTK